MKHLYLIGGTMGDGKTTISKLLYQAVPNSVFLDGDWCWMALPLIVTDETKQMVLQNITFLLNSFIRCTEYQNIIFCWVMHQQPIIDTILSKLPLQQVILHNISLTCSPEQLTRQLQGDIQKGIRKPDILAKSVARLPLYPQLNTTLIDTTGLSPEQVVQIILQT